MVVLNVFQVKVKNHQKGSLNKVRQVGNSNSLWIKLLNPKINLQDFLLSNHRAENSQKLVRQTVLQPKDMNQGDHLRRSPKGLNSSHKKCHKNKVKRLMMNNSLIKN